METKICSSLSLALFASSSFWDELTAQDESELQRLLAEENEERGADNLLSRGLFCGYASNHAGSHFDWMWTPTGRTKLALLAERLPTRVNEYDEGGMTPLMRAVQWGVPEVIRQLLARVPSDVDIDKPLEKDTNVRARNVARKNTASDDWNELNRQVVAKADWHTKVYLPAFQEQMHLFADQFLIADLATIVCAFCFYPAQDSELLNTVWPATRLCHANGLVFTTSHW